MKLAFNKYCDVMHSPHTLQDQVPTLTFRVSSERSVLYVSLSKLSSFLPGHHEAIAQAFSTCMTDLHLFYGIRHH